MRTIQPEILDIPEQSWIRKENFPEIIFENLGIYRENAVPFVTGSCQKFKPDVLIERNGAHAKVTKFVTNCAPFARARESSTKKVSQVKFSFSMVNEVMIQPDWLLEAKALLWPIYYPEHTLPHWRVVYGWKFKPT